MEILGRVEHEFLGSEFDWLAIDQQGNIGYFSTAGAGWIPESVLNHASHYDDIMDMVTALPVAGKSAFTFSGVHIDEWIQAADRGLYAFDWDRGTERYRLIARPTAHLTTETETGADVIDLASKTLLPCHFEKGSV